MGSIIEHLYIFFLLQNYDKLVDETTNVLLLACKSSKMQNDIAVYSNHVHLTTIN